ncbi:hypothetical protein C8J57DRAFT_1509549 [Mycena rebaudengoi]|nr:hypothetical protein C8J57DRAFT_1509549 [Mycena rebaudengoi]
MSPHSPLRTPSAVSLHGRWLLSPPLAALERISLPQTPPVSSLEDTNVRKSALRTEHTVPGAPSSGPVRASLPFITTAYFVPSTIRMDGEDGLIIIGEGIRCTRDGRPNTLHHAAHKSYASPHVLLKPVAR